MKFILRLNWLRAWVDYQAPPEQKAHFNELARIEKEEHMKK